MTREDLLDILERLVRRGKLTEEEAGAILAKFDRGEFEPSDLPLELDDALIVFDLFLLYLALQPRHVLMISLPAESRYDERFRLADEFYDDAKRLAAKLAQDGDYRAFHAAAQEAISTNLARQIALGKGAQLTAEEIARAQAGTLTEAEIQAIVNRVITPRDIQRAQDVALEQSSYLQRFVEEIAMREALGKPYSEGYVRERFQMYGGAAIGAMFQTIEAGLPEGWVIDYIAIDDDFTCTPCIRSEENGPYLPAEGPMPAVVCLGKRRCRCNRVPRYDPQEYERLRRAA